MLLGLAKYASDSGEGYQLPLLLRRPQYVIEGSIKALTWLHTAVLGRSDRRSQYQVMTAARTGWVVGRHMLEMYFRFISLRTPQCNRHIPILSSSNWSLKDFALGYMHVDGLRDSSLLT